MRLHRFLASAALLVGAPLVATAPAFAGAGGFNPGVGIPMQLPAIVQPWPQVAQVPIFGGPRAVAEQPPVATAPQTADIGDGVDHSPTFVAPGVEQNASGQLVHTP